MRALVDLATHLHAPPDLPEGYGGRTRIFDLLTTQILPDRQAVILYDRQSTAPGPPMTGGS